MRKLLHTILSVLALVMPLTALAQPYTAEQEEARLVGLSMIPEWAKEIANYGGGGGSSGTLYENNVYIKWRNAADSANIDVLKVDATDDTVLNADTGDVIKLSIAGTSEVQIDNDLISYTGTAAVLQSAGTLQLKLAADANRLVTFTAASDTAIVQSFGDATASQVFDILGTTANASDTQVVRITGGGAAEDAARGSFIYLGGADVGGANAGDAYLAATDDIFFQTSASGVQALSINDSQVINVGPNTAAARSVTWGNSGTTATQALSILASTADADDDSTLNLCAGGACTFNRGPSISLAGNETASAGDMVLTSGGGANADIKIKLFGTNGALSIANSSDVTMWDIVEATGVLRSSLTGATIAVDSGTAASACKGTLTANGATPVVTNTTCAATGAIPFLQKTNASTAANGTCTVTAVTNATSFTVECLANDTGTYSWWILKEG